MKNILLSLLALASLILLTGCPLATVAARGAMTRAAAGSALGGGAVRGGLAAGVVAGARASLSASVGDAALLRAGALPVARPLLGSGISRLPVGVAGGKNIGHVEMRAGSATIKDASGNILGTSRRIGNITRTSSNSGKVLGHAEHSMDGSQIRYFENLADGSTQYRGYDLIRGSRIKHFDASSRYLGTTDIELGGSNLNAVASLAIPAGILGAAAYHSASDRIVSAGAQPPAAPISQPNISPPSLRPQEFALRPGVPLNIHINGDRVEIWSDGPIQARADASSFQSPPHPGAKMRFWNGARTIQVIPAGYSATKLFLRRMED